MLFYSGAFAGASLAAIGVFFSTFIPNSMLNLRIELLLCAVIWAIASFAIWKLEQY